MINKENRNYFFLFGCFGSRLLLAYLSKKYQYNEFIFYLTGIIGSGFWIIYLFDLRKSGIEQPRIFWNSMRPVHGSLYLLYSYLNSIKYEYDYYILFFDTFIGLIYWLFF